MVRRGIYLSVRDECLYAWPPGLLTDAERAEIERHRGTIIRKLDWRIGRKPELRPGGRNSCRASPGLGTGTPP